MNTTSTSRKDHALSQSMYQAVLLATGILLSGCASSQMYRSPEHEAKIISIYDSKLAQWPVPFDTLRVPTRFGTTHVTVSGGKDKPPLVLLHAMGVTSMMWKDNIESLSRHFRTYAVDGLGDIGKSRLYDTDESLDDADRVQEWLNELLDSLGIQKACFAGASLGGWSAMHYAAREPNRVAKLALLGPMGIASVSLKVVWRILSLVWFPTESKKRDMIEWALSTNRRTRETFSEHMWVAMDCRGFLPTPWELSDEELMQIKAPTLLLLGERDEVIGSAAEAKERAEAFIPNARVKIITEAGHMMNTDLPDSVNAVLVKFLTEDSSLNALMR
ncbi:MAG TPA: hypothetical protein DCP63_12040 [Bacteroidetes bacterium]|nr:hypothetical protein [Bacteroidota bacterium]